MKKSMRILCIIFAIVCFAYYIRCAAYAGVKSSFIWIWLVGTAAFCILYILGLLEDRHIYTLPRMVKYISLVIICFGTALFITLDTAAKTPIVTGEEGICKGCGVATLSISYDELGRKTGEMAYNILVKGEDITKMKVEAAPNVTKEYVKDRCDSYGIKVPDDYTEIKAE